MIVLDKNNLVFFSEKENPYFQKVLAFKEAWDSGKTEFSIHTSGSTGVPKEIRLKRSQLIASAEMTGKTFGLKVGDWAFCCLNVEYIAGMMMLVRGFVLGLRMVVVEAKSSYDWQKIADDLPEFISNDSGLEKKTFNLPISFFAFVPLQLEAFAALEDSILQSFRQANIIVGGAAVGEHLLEKIQKLPMPIYATYGMTETITHIAIKRLNGRDKNDYFQVLAGVQIRKDERECLQICSNTTENQWITTNDLVEIKGKQYFKLVGRIDNVINSGGVKIQLEKVEREVGKILNKMQLNCSFFVYGIPDEHLGQRLVLVLEMPFTKTLKTEIFQGNLPKFEQPKQVFFVEQFIMTPSGKIDKIKTVNEFILHKIPNG